MIVPPGHRSRTTRRIAGAAGVYLALLGLALVASSLWARGRAAAQAGRIAQSTAASRASLLLSELQKYRLIPLVLSEYPDVHAALDRPSGTSARRLDDKLAQLAERIGSSAIYLIDGSGRTIAASNARLATSFVGQNYAFRPYFSQAMTRGAAEFFGLGTISGEPGLYLARRVGRGRQAGVIVVKSAFGPVEHDWAAGSDIAFVTDRDGIVLITNHPAWRFRSTGILSAQRVAEIGRARQFGLARLAPLPLRAEGDVAFNPRGIGRVSRSAGCELPLPLLGWRLRALVPLAPLEAGFLATARLGVILFAAVMSIPPILWLRARERADLTALTRIELEEQVARRTAELEAAQLRFREAREELAHANRLGSIGQITAAVAHEVNQPVGAIRAFADNGAEMLRRGDLGGAAANLVTIASLTERIGRITADLRTFARRGSGEIRPTDLGAALGRVLLFTGHLLRREGVVLRHDPAAGVIVHADPLRLEQVLVNLVHNAVEAQAATPPAGRRIHIGVADRGDAVHVVLADGGAGIAAAVADGLFTPFTTSKPDGLGLGLAIARDIARDLGGDLEIGAAPAGYTTAFDLRLRAAR